MKSLVQVVLAATLIGGVSANAQVPEIAFDSVPNALQLPAGLYLGEVAGVATNSRGDIFVYTRTGHPTITNGTARPFAHGGARLFQFDKTGKFTRELGQDSYAFQVAQQVRVDPQDNPWVVDQMSGEVMKFDQNGRVQMLLGRKSESERVPALPPNPPPPAAGEGGRGGRGPGGPGGPAAEGPPAGRGGGLPGAGAQSDIFQRPTDVAWDAGGNLYVAGGFGKRGV